MTREDFISTLGRCLRKAFLDGTWSFSTDEDEDAKICLDSKGFLLLNDVRTPYNVKDIERVKYGIDDVSNDDYYVSLVMEDGNRLKIGEADGQEYILLQTGKTPDIYLYKGDTQRCQ